MKDMQEKSNVIQEPEKPENEVSETLTEEKYEVTPTTETKACEAAAPEGAFDDDGCLPQKECETDAAQEENGTGLEEIAEQAFALENEVEPEEEEKTLSPRKRRREKRLRKMLDVEHDIRFRPPLSYRHLRMLAWLLIATGIAAGALALGGKFDANLAKKAAFIIDAGPTIRSLVMPLFMLAAFATIINGSKKFGSLIAVYGGFAFLIYALFLLIYQRYLVGLVMKFMSIDRASAVAMVDMLIKLFTENGYLSFNIFIDLFLCTLFTFFLLYNPKHIFVGKKLIVFRSLALIPFSWDMACLILKILSSLGKLNLSPYVFPLLTTKPPMTFIIFAFLVLFLKKRERAFKKLGGTQEDYLRFLKTNRNAVQFSKYAIVVTIACALLDLLVLVVASALLGAAKADVTTQQAIDMASSWGLGGTAQFLLILFGAIFFSYTKSYKETKTDLLIPLVGLVIVGLVLLECAYEGALYLPDIIKSLSGS